MSYYVRERPRWPIQSPNTEKKKKVKGEEEWGIRSSLLILEGKLQLAKWQDGKLQDSGKQEEGKTFHKLHGQRQSLLIHA